MIKALLFDLDGTLIDTNDLIITSFKYTFEKYLNFIPTESEILNLFGQPLEKALISYIEDDDRRNEFINVYRKYNGEKHDSLAKSFEGVREALQELGKEFKIAVVTSKRRSMACRGLELFGLDQLVDVLITPEDTENHKPDGEPAQYACSILGVKPEEAIMVGDSHNDILCGKNAGAKTCLVTYTVLNIKEIKELNPEYIVDNIIELTNVNNDIAV